MIKLLRMSGLLYIQSFAYMIPYMIIGSLYDTNLITVFGFMYPLQFLIYLIVYYAEAIGTISVVRDGYSHNSKEAQESRSSALTIMLIASSLIILIISIFIREYLSIFGDYGYLDIAGISLLVSFISYSTVWLLSILDDMTHNGSKYYTVLFLAASVLSIIITIILKEVIGIEMTTNRIAITIAIINTSLLIYLIYRYNRLYGLGKITLKHLKSGKASASTIVSNLSYFLVYMLCYKRSGTVGIEEATVLATLSIYGDSIWDAECAIPEHYMAISDNGNKDMVWVVLKRSLVLGIILSISLTVLSFISGLIYINKLLIIAEVIGLITLCIKDVFQSFVSVSLPIKICTVIFSGYAILRFILAYRIKDMYSSEYSMGITNTIMIIVLIIVYFKHKNRVNNI